uniref:Uncharacterized protein n=1 Tax=Timema genevievae TaxID=629358 RepID=A0A7R9JTB8_TIMGE|nr:unnamed protein product [Timema genevievae]
MTLTLGAACNKVFGGGLFDEVRHPGIKEEGLRKRQPKLAEMDWGILGDLEDSRRLRCPRELRRTEVIERDWEDRATCMVLALQRERIVTCVVLALNRFLNNKFEDSYTPTIEDFHRKLYRIRGEVHQLDILDTSGNHPFPAMRRLSFLTGQWFDNPALKSEPSRQLKPYPCVTSVPLSLESQGRVSGGYIAHCLTK